MCMKEKINSHYPCKFERKHFNLAYMVYFLPSTQLCKHGVASEEIEREKESTRIFETHIPNGPPCINEVLPTYLPTGYRHVFLLEGFHKLCMYRQNESRFFLCFSALLPAYHYWPRIEALSCIVMPFLHITKLVSCIFSITWITVVLMQL